MKRDILFKAKGKHTNLWVKGDYMLYSMQEFLILRGTLGRIEIVPDTLCQYVGIKTYWENENKEDIEYPLWEHDLLEIEIDGQIILTEVKFECSTFILASNKLNDGYIPLLDVIELDETPWIRGKVVGNIFDNPELIEEYDYVNKE